MFSWATDSTPYIDLSPVIVSSGYHSGDTDVVPHTVITLLSRLYNTVESKEHFLAKEIKWEKYDTGSIRIIRLFVTNPHGNAT